jgi:LPPG:FO 2-phospho-L-lactate transferase
VRITVLAGGIGGARFLRGVRAGYPDAEITAIVNTGDDIIVHGLRVSPDLDSVMYTLGGGIDPDRGWGRAGETWRIKDDLAIYGVEPSWFGLGDLDIATHLVRTQMIDAGYSLTDVTAALCERWQPGIRLLPMTDQRCETHVIVEIEGERKAIHFEQWWIQYRAAIPTLAFVQIGIEDAKPAPGVVEAIADADIVLVGPSNPVVSIGTILGVPGIREALRATPAKVIGLSPIIGDAPVRGMADSCLKVIGVEVSAAGVGRLYGARSADGILDGWLIADSDSADLPGVEVRAVPLLMTTDELTADMVHAALELAGV